MAELVAADIGLLLGLMYLSVVSSLRAAQWCRLHVASRVLGVMLLATLAAQVT